MRASVALWLAGVQPPEEARAEERPLAGVERVVRHDRIPPTRARVGSPAKRMRNILRLEPEERRLDSVQ